MRTKESRAESDRKYRENNRAAINRRIKDWQSRNKDRIKARKRVWYAETVEVRRGTRKAWRSKNSAKENSRVAAWRAAHPDRAKAATDRWLEENWDKMLETRRRYRANNPEQFRKRKQRGRGCFGATRPRPDLCECCGGPPVGNKKVLSLDHCHATGKFRGWLCDKCNLGMGTLGDTLEALSKAVTYLQGVTHD